MDGGPGQAEPRWVRSGPTVLEANLTFSLMGLRSGVTVKMLMSTGRKDIGVWQLQAMAGPPPPARTGHPPRCWGLYTGLSVWMNTEAPRLSTVTEVWLWKKGPSSAHQPRPHTFRRAWPQRPVGTCRQSTELWAGGVTLEGTQVL